MSRDHCSHGAIARECLICEKNEEIAELRAEVARLRATQASATDRRAPVQASPLSQWSKAWPAGTIAWAEHVAAWEGYAANHGRIQDAERIAERGGFSFTEICIYLGREPSTWEARDGEVWPRSGGEVWP